MATARTWGRVKPARRSPNRARQSQPRYGLARHLGTVVCRGVIYKQDFDGGVSLCSYRIEAGIHKVPIAIGQHNNADKGTFLR